MDTTNWRGCEQAARDLRAGRIPIETAREVERQASEKLVALKLRAAKAPPMAYADEIDDAQDGLRILRGAIGDAEKVVCIFHRPAKRFGRYMLPELKVVRLGQTAFIELDGRHRVRDWWGLLVNGVRLAEGPKRWIMKNAQGAAMMDAAGKLPGWILLTGLDRRRSKYRRRRDRRRLELARKRARLATRRTGTLHLVGADVRLKLMVGDRVVGPLNPDDMIWKVGVDFTSDPAAG